MSESPEQVNLAIKDDEEHPEEEGSPEPAAGTTETATGGGSSKAQRNTNKENELRDGAGSPGDDQFYDTLTQGKEVDPEVIAQNRLIEESEPTTELEKALFALLERKDSRIRSLTTEITKLRGFISKRKQTYKRKRKDDGAPIRAMSAYNMFIKERFAQLAKENEEALKSTDADASLKRIPPADLIAKTGGEWKELPAEVKQQYEER